MRACVRAGCACVRACWRAWCACVQGRRKGVIVAKSSNYVRHLMLTPLLMFLLGGPVNLMMRRYKHTLLPHSTSYYFPFMYSFLYLTLTHSCRVYFLGHTWRYWKKRWLLLNHQLANIKPKLKVWRFYLIFTPLFLLLSPHKQKKGKKMCRTYSSAAFHNTILSRGEKKEKKYLSNFIFRCGTRRAVNKDKRPRERKRRVNSIPRTRSRRI